VSVTLNVTCDPSTNITFLQRDSNVRELLHRCEVAQIHDDGLERLHKLPIYANVHFRHEIPIFTPNLTFSATGIPARLGHLLT
jgi:hypothetical protein